MITGKSILITFFISIYSSGFCQPVFPEKGIFSEDELRLKECTFEKDAEAIILLDEATSNHDDEYRLITKRRIRIKILNEKGLNWANIIIPYYSKDKFETISDVEGFTYNYKGTGQAGEMITLEKKQIFTEKVNDRFSNIKFALPSVSAGSIIEYWYTSEMKHYGGLRSWDFQSEIPILKSAYLLTIIPNTEFSYIVSKKINYDILILPLKKTGQIYFEMNNIPGLKNEPFMNAPKDYIQRVEFQLSSYKSVYGVTMKVDDTWNRLAKDLSQDEELGSAMKKDLPGLDPLRTLLAGETSLQKKLAIIYKYVQLNFSWNGLDSKYTSEGLKKIMEKRNGTSGELNLVMVNLLQIFGIEAYPLLVAERSFGNVDPRFPLIDRFNKTVVYAVIEEKTFILDVTDKYCPPDIIPYPLLNTYALVVNKNTKELTNINADNTAFNSHITLNSKIAKEGILSGTASIWNKQYATQHYTRLIKENEPAFIKNVEEENQNIEVINFKSNIFSSDTGSFIFQFDFKKDLHDNSGFILLNYNLLTGLLKNPFTKNIRFTDINFGYPYSVISEHIIELPEGTKLDLPVDKTVTTPKKDMLASRKFEKKGNKLFIKIEISRIATFYPVNAYSVLQLFYKDMLMMFNEPVTIKLAKNN